MRLRRALAVALLACAPLAAQEPASPSLLERTFRECLAPAALPPQATVEALAQALQPAQKEAAKNRLRALEEGASDAQLEEIAHGYALLDFPADALRLQGKRQGLLPGDAGALTKAAQAAYAEGRIRDAVELAAQALSIDPTDPTAEAFLKLAEPKLSGVAITARDPFNETARDAPVSARSVSPEAGESLKRAVAARRAGDLDATLRGALDAMRADPASPTVQEFYNVVVADRAKQARRLSAALGFLGRAADAERDGDKARALALARQAAAVDPNPVILRYVDELARSAPARAAAPQAPAPPLGQTPPAVPIGLGGLLIAMGALAWKLRGKEQLDSWRRDLATSGAIAGVGIGAIGVAYGGWLMLGAAGMAAPPSMAAAGAGEVAAASTVDGAALAGATAGTARLALSGLSLAKSGGATEEKPRQINSAKRRSTLRDLKRFKPWADDRSWIHILEGEGPNNGGHRASAPDPTKSKFPADWSDDKIRGAVMQILNDETSDVTFQTNKRLAIDGVRNGVDIRVIVEGPERPNYGRIVTAFPNNVPLNP